MKRTALALLVICAGLLGGCSAHELEDRCFPMLAVVDLAEDEDEALVGYTFPDTGDGESEEYTQETQTEEINTTLAAGASFGEALQAYELRLNKTPDCNHLKVLVLSRAFCEDEAQYEAMMAYLKETEEYPRNAYVCIVEDVEAFLALDGQLSDDLGSYLEDYLQTHEGEHEQGLVTLGQLLDEESNHMLELVLPVISVKDGSLVWEEKFLSKIQK